MYCRDEGQLGIAPAAAVGVASGAVSAVKSLFGGGNVNDPTRLARNTEWYQLALAGDAEAAKALKHMSGRYGRYDGGPYCGGGCAGWATSKAKNDALAKWQALESQVTAASPVAAETGTYTAPSRGGTGLSTGILALIGVVVVGGVAMATARPRRR